MLPEIWDQAWQSFAAAGIPRDGGMADLLAEAAAPAPKFAAVEPAFIEGANATTVLVRRVKQGVAEWLRIQIKEKTWKGLVEHALDGWNIGPAPYGYLADRSPHPAPVKASLGRTKTRLALDPARAPVVEQIFTWRTVDKLGPIVRQILRVALFFQDF